MTSAEQSFKESLRAFNSGRSNTGTGGPLASIFPSSSSRAYQDGVDMESQESLLGSFQERASCEYLLSIVPRCFKTNVLLFLKPCFQD